MSKKNELPEEGGNVNWERLERFSKGSENKRHTKKKKKEASSKEVNEEVSKLSAEEKALPYPDEFLAEINLMRRAIDGGTIDLMALPGMEDDSDEDLDDNFDDEVFDEDDLDDFDDEDDEDFDGEDFDEDEDIEDDKED